MKKCCWLVLLLASAACNSKKEETVDLGIYLFEVGLIQVNDISSLNGGEQVKAPHYFTNTAFLIRHPKGDLIWDTGFNDTTVYYPQGEPTSPFYSTMSHTLKGQIAGLGIDADLIEYLAVSHLHPDHIGNMEIFTGATLLLQEEEYAALFEPGGQGPENLRDNPSLKLKGDHDVFGDGLVRIIRTPGHTAGHQVLLVNLPETGPVILSGDLFLFRDEVKTQRVPFFNMDKIATQNSWTKVRELMKETGAQLWVQHDSVQMMQIPHAPEMVR